jgi:hypothetical protein
MNRSKRINKKIDNKIMIIIILIIGFIFIITVTITKNDLLKKPISIEKSNSVDIKGEEDLEIKLTDRITSLLAKNFNISDDSISILYVSDIKDDILVMFLYKDKNKNYEGLCQLTKDENSYDILTTSIKEVDKHTPFTVNTLEIEEDFSESYKIIGGIINDKDIKSININFHNNTMANVLIGEDKSYFYVKEQQNLDILSIEALDDSFKIFHQWSGTEKSI